MIIKQIETQKRVWSFEFDSDFACPIQLPNKGASDFGFDKIFYPASLYVHPVSRILLRLILFNIDKPDYLVYQIKRFPHIALLHVFCKCRSGGIGRHARFRV